MTDRTQVRARPVARAPEGLLAAWRRRLPAGSALPEGIWWGRHRAIVVLLWFHAAVIPVFSLVRGYSLGHTLLESSIVPLAALLASSARFSRRQRTAIASIGLLSSSAVLVHLSGGLIEMHFHFFVMVAVVALYQDWVPFLAAIGYVLLHHGVIGALEPASVFNHPAAQADPWRWAGIHAFFVACISVACLVTWRLNETILADRRSAEERLREESRIVETLNEVGRSLAAELDLQRVVQTVTDAATELTGAAFGAFFYNVADEEGESYLLYSISGVPMEAFSSFPLPRNTEVFAPTFGGRGVVRVDDVTEDPRYGKNPPYNGMPEGHLPVCSYLAVPVLSRSGEVLGGLFFGHPERAMFDATDERLAVGIAAHASVAIDNARLYEAQWEARQASERAQRRLSIIADGTRLLNSSLEEIEILRNLANLVVPVVADACAIDVVEADGSIREAVTLHPNRLATDDPSAAGRDTAMILGAIRAGATQVVDGDERPSKPKGAAVPIATRREVIGAVWFQTGIHTERSLEPDDIRLVEELARRAGIAIEKARLYNEQRSAAELLQHSLLPEQLPEWPGVETTARYIPGASGFVGGDWYDVLEVPDGSLVVAMGDVVGRGVRAASLMGQLRSALRAYALQGEPPARVLAMLNDYLAEIGSYEHMATLVVAKFDPESGLMRFANAGHPPPMLVTAHEQRYLEGGRSVPIGVAPSPNYAEDATTLLPGDLVLLYTDGLIEDRGMTIDEGMERLSGAVAEPFEGLDDLCEHVLERALAGRDCEDDVALVALRWSHVGSHLEVRVPARPAVLRPLRSALRRLLASVGVDDEEMFEMLVASGEAFTNAIQHATGAEAKGFEVEADVGDEFTLRVRDHGRWREPRIDDGGRGLKIMAEFMDHVDVKTDEDGTEVFLRRSLTGARGDGGRS